jgi:hypothetical protein
MTRHTPRDRDRALQKLRDWRTTIALGSAGAVVGLAAVAAATIPGKAQNPTTTTTTTNGDGTTQQPGDAGASTQDGSQAPDSSGSLQAPQQMPGSGFGGGRQATSGGSH